ncbi:MAG: hypothetical protein ACKO37_02180 [Vampirovibrionales bacterium]
MIQLPSLKPLIQKGASTFQKGKKAIARLQHRAGLNTTTMPRLTLNRSDLTLNPNVSALVSTAINREIPVSTRIKLMQHLSEEAEGQALYQVTPSAIKRIQEGMKRPNGKPYPATQVTWPNPKKMLVPMNTENSIDTTKNFTDRLAYAIDPHYYRRISQTIPDAWKPKDTRVLKPHTDVGSLHSFTYLPSKPEIEVQHLSKKERNHVLNLYYRTPWIPAQFKGKPFEIEGFSINQGKEKTYTFDHKQPIYRSETLPITVLLQDALVGQTHKNETANDYVNRISPNVFHQVHQPLVNGQPFSVKRNLVSSLYYAPVNSPPKFSTTDFQTP